MVFRTNEQDVSSRAKARKGIHHVEDGMKKKREKKNKKIRMAAGKNKPRRP